MWTRWAISRPMFWKDLKESSWANVPLRQFQIPAKPSSVGLQKSFAWGWVVRISLVGAVALCIVLSASNAQAADDPTSISVLLQTNDIVVAPDGSSVETVHAELHAENDAGAIRLGQVPLEFNSARQDLQIIEAYTLKPDGTKIPIDTSAIYVRLPPDEEQQGMITDLRLKVIVYPQTAAGDTVVYTAKFVDSTPMFPGVYTYGRAFSSAAPFKEVRDTITAPKSMNLRVETHDLEFKSDDSGQNVVYRWHYSVVHPHADKVVPVSPMDQMPRYFVSNFKDYAELGRAYSARTSGKVAVTPKVAALAEKLTAGESNPREQTRKIYEWVTGHVRYIAIELGQGTIVPHDVDEILTYGYGDCKDHDLLVRALLKAKGIASQSVLINSSNAYTLTQVPTFAQLDHVITFVPDLKLYLDSTTPTTPFGSLPYSEYGKPVIFVSENSATLGTMPVLSPGVASEHTTNVMHLSATGVLTGTMTTTAEGPSSIRLRLMGLAIQAVGPEKVASTELAAHGYKGGTGTLTAGPPMVPGRGYTIAGSFTVPGWAEWLTGQKVSYMPVGLRILGVAGDGPMGSFTSIESKDMSPTPCFSIHQSEDASLEIPPNTIFAAVPGDARVMTENVQFTSHWTQSNNTLSVHREFISKIDQPLCTGAVRQKMARTLLEIAISYLGQIRIVPATSAPALVSQNAAPLLGPKPVGGYDEIAFNDSMTAAKFGDADRASRLIGALAASNHTDAPTTSMHLAQGLSYLQNSQPAEAVAELSEAIRLNPDAGSESYSARASAYSLIGKNKLAVADLDMALKSAPDDLHLRQTHAELLTRLRDYDGAAADYNIIVRANPNDPALILKRADVRYHADKYDEAAADYRRASKLGARLEDVQPGLCHSLARTDAFAQAVSPCSRVLQQDAESGAGLESRGYAYFRLGKYSEALNDFERAVKADPQSVKYLYERGVAKIKAGNAAEGQRDIGAATKLVPNIVRKVPEKMAL